jgi:hypothetical protein
MARTRTATAPAHSLVDRPDEITHIVCCRAPTWRTALCGAEDATEINLAARHYCSICMEEAEAMRPGWLLEPDGICPVDGRRCPSDAEIDARIAQLTGTDDGP